MELLTRCLQLCGVYTVWSFVSFCKSQWNQKNIVKSEAICAVDSMLETDQLSKFLLHTLKLHQQGKLIQTELFSDLLFILQKHHQSNQINQINQTIQIVQEKNDEMETKNIMSNYILGWYMNQFVVSCSDDSQSVTSSMKK